MKKSKKLAALVLAMVMALSLMAVTAAAYGEEHVHDGTCCEEAIQPRKPGAPECPSCNILMTDTGGGYENEKPVRYFRCSKCGDTAWRYL